MFEVSNIHKDFFSFLSASAAAAAIPSMKQWEEGKMGTISFSFQKFPRDFFQASFYSRSGKLVQVSPLGEAVLQRLLVTGNEGSYPPPG